MNLRLPGAALVIFLLLGAISASTQNLSTVSQLNDQCVMCHVNTYNEGMAQKYKHQPFFERQYVHCHVVEDAQQALAAMQEALPVTGEVVSQETVWAKRTVLPGTAEPSRTHMAVVQRLDSNAEYRFRIVLNQDNDRQGSSAVPSLWLGLRPAEVAASNAPGGPTEVTDLTKKTSGMISSLELYQEGGSTVFFSWQTDSPLFSWLELENVESSVTATSDATQSAEAETPAHPKLRDPEDLTIEVCYTCHSPGELGTSHPVRLYAKHGKTIIPRDLPTIEDGMMTCVTCHGAHGAPGKQLVREAVQTKLCVACHIEFKGSSKATTF